MIYLNFLVIVLLIAPFSRRQKVILDTVLYLPLHTFIKMMSQLRVLANQNVYHEIRNVLIQIDLWRCVQSSDFCVNSLQRLSKMNRRSTIIIIATPHSLLMWFKSGDACSNGNYATIIHLLHSIKCGGAEMIFVRLAITIKMISVTSWSVTFKETIQKWRS